MAFTISNAVSKMMLSNSYLLCTKYYIPYKSFTGSDKILVVVLTYCVHMEVAVFNAVLKTLCQGCSYFILHCLKTNYIGNLSCFTLFEIKLYRSFEHS